MIQQMIDSQIVGMVNFPGGSAPVESIPDQTHSILFVRATGDHAAIADAAQNGVLDIASTFTFECWVKFTTVPLANVFSIQAKWETTGGQGSWIWQIQNVTGVTKMRCFVSPDGADVHAADSEDITLSILAATWYHFAVSWDPAAGTTPATEFEFYLDGVSLGVTTLADIDPTAIFNSTGPFAIGAQDGGDVTFDGRFADVRVWNTVRTPTEINDNKAVNIDPETVGLVGLWLKTDELILGKMKDETVNENHLTITGGTYSTDSPY